MNRNNTNIARFGLITIQICVAIIVVVVVVFILHRSFYPSTSAVHPVSVLILQPREIKLCGRGLRQKKTKNNCGLVKIVYLLLRMRSSSSFEGLLSI